MRAIALSFAGITVMTGFAATAGAEPKAHYEVTFERTWSSGTHPQDFPLLAHFSPVIGVTHGRDYELFAPGATAGAGLEKLCEEGKHQPLDAELRDAMASGKVGSVIETGDPIRSASGKAVSEFDADADHSRVSIGAMIAPSPDWCAVAADVELYENGEWVAEKTVPLTAWDMGTDSATSYRALDADTQPRGPVSPSDSPYFVREGQQVPVGTVHFVRK